MAALAPAALPSHAVDKDDACIGLGANGRLDAGVHGGLALALFLLSYRWLLPKNGGQ